MARLGIDIGGTFTDFVTVDSAGKLHLDKKPTTPRHLIDGIATGLEPIKLGPEIDIIGHGTTVGVNALLELSERPIGLITTKGFRDIYEIGRHNRVDMYDLTYRKPEPLAPREFRLEVEGRMDAEGKELEPLSERSVISAAEKLRQAGVQSVAVVLLHSYVNPAHEVRAGKILRETFPDAYVSLSHEMVREWREYERTSTTGINAYILPLVSTYLDDVEALLAKRSYSRPFYISKSSGGLMSTREARGCPVHSIMSGPAGGAVATAFLGEQLGLRNLIGFDMGGTSADVSLVQDGGARITYQAEIDRHPILVPMVDISTIGAGGGSIAWIDPGGALRVGPRSAGAEPGPAAYGRGGTEPTVTDANLVLGRIDPDHFLGGEMKVDESAAKAAVQEKISNRLDLDVIDAADGIITVVNTRMAHAVRAVTIERGLDPRDFVLLAFGGAGPLHAAAIAAELGVGEVVIPPAPGAFSALGIAVSDVRYDFSRTHAAELTAGQIDAIRHLVEAMDGEARDVLKGDGLSLDRMEQIISVDLRYVGQEHTLTVTVRGGIDESTLMRLSADFDAMHAQSYGHSAPGEAKEIVSVRLTAFARMDQVELREVGASEGLDGDSATRSVRKVFFMGRGFIDCRFIDRSRLSSGTTLQGPVIIEEKGCTTLVPPDFQVRLGDLGTLHLLREADDG